MSVSKLNFDISKVQLSRVYSYTQGNKGAYLKADWLGRPTYLRNDEEGWGILSAGRLDEQANRIYKDFLEERNNHKYRPDYAIAAEMLETDYVEFQKQLNDSFYKPTLWKIQVLASKFFGWVLGSKPSKDLEFIAPQGNEHSLFYFATLSCTIKASELAAANLLAPGSVVEDYSPMGIVGGRTEGACYLPLEDEGNQERFVGVAFDYWVWKRHAESQDPTILDTYKSMVFAIDG